MPAAWPRSGGCRSARRAKDRFAIDWAGYRPPRPTFLGTRRFADYPVAELVPYIDWTPFFAAWEIKGTYPLLFNDPKVGEAARALFDDAQAMLRQMVAENWLTASGVIGFWPANADGDDIVVYADEARTAERARLYTLRQQIARQNSKRGHVALSDFVAPRDTGLADFIGGFAVTAGIGEEAVAERFARANDDYSKILQPGARRPAGRGLCRAHAPARAPRVLGLRAGRGVHARGADPRGLSRHPPGAGLPGPARPHREGRPCSTSSTRRPRPASS